MDHEDSSCEVAKPESLEPRTPLANDTDSVSPFVDSDSSEDDNGERVMRLSPLCNQYNDKMRIDSSSCECDLVSDDEIVETMYRNLVRIVVSLQINVAVGEIWCFDGCKTPPSSHPESKMVPDTCPGAPMKLTKITRNIDSGLRRKLF